jgi:2,4-dienoyl-CoA reductase (NADPH2)
MGREDEINTCIGCNQACLDHVFVYKRVSCLVNPVAGYEKTLKLEPLTSASPADKSAPSVSAETRRIAVIGAGPAGLACASACAYRGHKVTLFDRETVLGGQFNMAKCIPGKEEFYETIRYFKTQLHLQDVDVRLGVNATPELLNSFEGKHTVLNGHTKGTI